MGIFNHFPWSEEHQLNLDWILRSLKDLLIRVKALEDSGGGGGGGGGGGTSDYEELSNKPQINNVTLEGNKSLLDLGIINRFPGLNLPKMNSSSPSAGGSSRFSREDHVHPSDTSRTTSTQVGSMITSALAWYDPASKSFDPPYNAGTIGKAIEDALAGGVTPEAIQAAVDAYLDDHPAMTGMFTNAAKNALISLLEKVAYIDGNGQQYLDELITNLAATVTSISAVFTQGSAVIYDTDSLDTLKQYLVVTADYSDGTSATVTLYTLSGTLTVGTSTITVSYGGQTDTFSVTVTDTSLWTFTSGYTCAKSTSGASKNNIYKQETQARACGAAPIENHGYVFTVTDSTKYNLAAYDVTSLTHTTNVPSAAIEGFGYVGSTKSVAWATSDSVSTPYVWLALKKMDGTEFTNAELANGAAAVFTYTEGT